MKRTARRSLGSLALLCGAGLLVSAGAAHAYVGPGLGLGTLAVVLGVIGSVFIALFALLWYPVKRMFKKRKNTEVSDAPEQNDPNA